MWYWHFFVRLFYFLVFLLHFSSIFHAILSAFFGGEKKATKWNARAHCCKATPLYIILFCPPSLLSSSIWCPSFSAFIVSVFDVFLLLLLAAATDNRGALKRRWRRKIYIHSRTTKKLIRVACFIFFFVYQKTSFLKSKLTSKLPEFLIFRFLYEFFPTFLRVSFYLII